LAWREGDDHDGNPPFFVPSWPGNVGSILNRKNGSSLRRGHSIEKRTGPGNRICHSFIIFIIHSYFRGQVGTRVGGPRRTPGGPAEFCWPRPGGETLFEGPQREPATHNARGLLYPINADAPTLPFLKSAQARRRIRWPNRCEPKTAAQERGISQ